MTIFYQNKALNKKRNKERKGIIKDVLKTGEVQIY